ncbi:hypothetical protein FLONG3_4567 [Fusarium longipes]|uniref:Uncharacterized protein n=1 Tax=Fusarium longipes TaxID=694270 RepID=A0A395SZ33_9HYPO|nr:hypothetical protein FLONG3_4567 [Fusarium longipes]
MKWLTVVIALASSALVTAAPIASSISPNGPCPQSKIDAILSGEMDASECCSYGRSLDLTQTHISYNRMTIFNQEKPESACQGGFYTWYAVGYS